MHSTIAIAAITSILPTTADAAAALAPQAPTECVPARVFAGREEHGAAYDTARQRLVLFGGDGHMARPLGETWERSSGSWILRAPVMGPPPGRDCSLAYDAARARTVAVCRRGSLAETWEWNGAAWTSRAAAPAIDAIAYDAARQRVVMFLGRLAQTWEYDGASWTRRTPASRPPAREQHALAYDAARQRVVLFGGYDGSLVALADTWEWDGSTWTQRRPASSPPARAWHALAYDAGTQRVVLYGGGLTYVGGSTLFADTWEWDGAVWTQRTPAAGPPPLTGHSLTYDAGAQRVVLCGGRTSVAATAPRWGACSSDTWEWDGTTWTLAAPDRPGPRANAAMAADEARQGVLLFGGEAGAAAIGDTWEWDGVGWRREQPPSSPSPRSLHAMAADAGRSRVVLFGGWTGNGNLGDTWEWDGANWTARPTAAAPSARSGCAMAYDAARQRTVLFGGSDGSLRDDTWEWDGTTWTQRAPAGIPFARWCHSLAYDAARQRVVLHGGLGPNNVGLGDTWEWDGTTWTRQFTATNPASGASAYDPVRQRVVLFGADGTWEFDGAAWTRRAPAIGLGPYTGIAAAYHAAREQVVGFGGGMLQPSGKEYSGETWLLGNHPSASASALGVGCGGSAGAPVLDGNDPYLGNPTLVLDLLAAQPSAPCVFGLAAASQNVGIGGCTLYLKDPLVLVPASSNAIGFAALRLAVPNVVALRGQSLFAQAFVADLAAAPLSVAFTAGRQLVVGD